MKILYFDYGFEYPPIGGEQVRVAQELSYLSENNETLLAYPDFSPNLRLFREIDPHKTPFRIKRFPLGEIRNGGIARLKEVLHPARKKQMKSLKSLIKDFSPDIIHHHFGALNRMVESVIVGRKMGIPQVATFHVSWPFCIHGTFYNYSRKLSCLNKILCGECITHRSKVLSQMISTIYCNTIARRVLNAIDHYVCYTPYHLELLKSLGIDGSQATILPPGIHLLPQVEIKSIFERKYITYSGRLEEEKGVYLFLEVAKRFKSSDNEFLIIGNGYLKSELKKKAEEESLKIKFADWIVNREDYFDLIRQSKIVVIPSLWPETFGMVILDAYQCGTPVIGTNMGGIPFIIENDKSGFIVSPEVDEIVEKINTLLTNTSLWHQFSKCGLEIVAKKNTWRENALQLQKIYTSLLKR